MWHDITAEAAKQIRRPAHWMLLAVAVGLTLSFGYLVPYASYTGDAPGIRRDGLGPLLPDHFPAVAVGGTPVFVGALALILGALVLGSEYSWQTWKTVLTQRSGRLTVYAAKLIVIAAGAVTAVLVLFACSAATSAAIAQLENQHLSWPAWSEAARTFGAGALICTMWAALGAALAVILRSVATSVGIGLVWMLAVQNLLSAIAAPALDWVASAQKGLPGPNAGSLAASLGANPNAPGIDQLVPGGQATAVIAAYLAAFTLTGALLIRRRDIT